jgi:hypothetical protein
MQLIDIQKLQFSDRTAAEAMMLAFLKKNEDPDIEHVELMPKPESLNSINGFLRYSDGELLFFKTHVEENEQLSEYYNASMLAAAGYPVIEPRQIRHRPGKQIVLYEIISFPTLFDLLKAEEDAQLSGRTESDRSRLLLAAQAKLESKVASIYEKTLKIVPAGKASDPPVNQLFYHRLGENGRLGLFYRGKTIRLPHRELGFDQLASMSWTINGVRYAETLAQIIERSRRLLAPRAGLTVVGHGDAHNGNIFVDLDNQTLKMFDPAFAGCHDPLLDLTKPLFHNIFARWMYYPEQTRKELDLSFSVRGGEIVIEHDFMPSGLRLLHLQAKKDNLLKPVFSMLTDGKWNMSYGTNGGWREFLRSALFCCPFLTVNLFAAQVADGTLAERYSLPVKLLGLCLAVAFGSAAHSGEDALSTLIDGIFEI